MSESLLITQDESGNVSVETTQHSLDHAELLWLLEVGKMIIMDPTYDKLLRQVSILSKGSDPWNRIKDYN